MATTVTTTFSLDLDTREKIDNLSQGYDSRSRWLNAFVEEFADDFRQLRKTLNNAVEIAPHLKTLQGNCRQMHTGRTKIRDWDKEIMSILKTGREIGKVTDPENMYLFHEMVNRLIVALQEEEAKGWEEPEHEGIKF